MKQLRLMLAVTMSACCLGVWAEGKQTVTVNGLAVEKSVKKITFSGCCAFLSLIRRPPASTALRLLNRGLWSPGCTTSTGSMWAHRSAVCQKASTL